MVGIFYAGEVTGHELIRYIGKKLLAAYGKKPKATDLVDTRTFYLMPIFDSDGGDRVLSRDSAWSDHDPSQRTGRDLDEDGSITNMRVKDPNGLFYFSHLA